MRGNTATISVTAFRADWLTHMPISSLCERWTITKDQVLRLRDVWQLPLRNDRKLRYKPKQRETDPTPREIKQRAAAIRATWDDDTEARRRGAVFRPYEIPDISLTDEARDAIRWWGDE